MIQKDQVCLSSSKSRLISNLELYNLLNIYASVRQVDANNLENIFESDNMFSFKVKLADALIDTICPIGERIRAIQREEGSVF